METTQRQLPVIEPLTQQEKIKYSSKDVAAMLRKQVKVAFPDCKFSITVHSYAGGSNLNVTLLSSPFKAFKTFEELDYTEQRKLVDRLYNSNEEKAKQWLSNLKHDSINQFWIEDSNCHYYFKKEVLDIMAQIIKFVNQYNWDNSDAMTDYFDVHFHTSFAIGSWDKPYEVKQ